MNDTTMQTIESSAEQGLKIELLEQTFAALAPRGEQLVARFYEELFKRYSNIPVKYVLEIACGNCPHMLELSRRGYKYAGLDLNEAMLNYSRDRAQKSGIDAELIRADMIDFKIDKQVDFAYIMLGSLSVKSNTELESHFSAVAGAVKTGGLYLLDWCIQFEGHHENDKGRRDKSIDQCEMEASGSRRTSF